MFCSGKRTIIGCYVVIFSVGFYLPCTTEWRRLSAGSAYFFVNDSEGDTWLVSYLPVLVCLQQTVENSASLYILILLFINSEKCFFFSCVLDYSDYKTAIYYLIIWSHSWAIQPKYFCNIFYTFLPMSILITIYITV